MSDSELTLVNPAYHQFDKFRDIAEFFSSNSNFTFTGSSFNEYKAKINELTDLTKFNLNQANPTDNPTIEDVLKILKNNPKLKDFSVHTEAELEPGAEPGPESPIKLPELTSLFLTIGRWENVKRIIAHIQIPKLTALEIRCASSVPLSDAIQHIRNVSSLNLPYLTMDFRHPNAGITWRGTNEEMFSIDHVSPEDMRTALEGKCPHFSDRNIKRLGLKFDIYAQILLKSGSFPALETVTVRRETITADQENSIRAFANSRGLHEEKISRKKCIWQK